MSEEEVRKDLGVEFVGTKIRVIGPVFVDFVGYGRSEGSMHWPNGDGRHYWEGEIFDRRSGVLVLMDGQRVAFVRRDGTVVP